MYVKLGILEEWRQTSQYQVQANQIVEIVSGREISTAYSGENENEENESLTAIMITASGIAQAGAREGEPGQRRSQEESGRRLSAVDTQGEVCSAS